jgi:hypothetical protein
MYRAISTVGTGRRAGPATRSSWLLAASAALAALLLAVVAPGASAAKPPAPPRVGPWKIILATNTPRGPIVTNKVIGGFKISRHRTITGFHLNFTEEGESTECARGSLEAPKSGSISIPSTQPVPIIKAGRTWQVAANTGSIGGGSLQPEVVNVTAPSGVNSPGSQLSITLVSSKGPRYGRVSWAQDHCSVAFVVQPG